MEANGVPADRAIKKLALNLVEAAMALGVARNTMRELIELRRVKAIRVGRRLVIPVSELERFLEGGSDAA